MADENGVQSTAEQPEQTVNGTSSDAPTTNGNAEVTKTATDAPLTQVAAPEDSVPENATATATEPKNDAPASTTGTPANGKGKRKSSSGVPEHKSKKLNKKKSMPNLNLDAKPGDYFWARWRGSPAWPSIVVAQDMLPPELLAKRPVSAQQEDGSYRADFQEGGKNAKDRQYPILFLGENNMTWIVNSQLTKLDKEDCNGWENKKLAKGLQKAYEIVAAGAPGLDHFRAMLNDAAEERMRLEVAEKEAELAAEAKQEEEAAAKAAKAAEPKPKKPRKSKSAVDADAMHVDQDGAEAEKPSKKRKKDAVSDGEQPAKKPAKVRLSTSKPAKEKDTPAKKPAKTKQTAAKAAPEAEKDQDPTDEIRVAIMFLRHKLQKGFLSRDTPVSSDDIPQFADWLAQLEAVPELESPIIRTTKIHKVLKNILKLPEIPRDTEFNFSKRCAALLKTWEETLAKDGALMSAIEPSEGKTATTNGVSNSEDKDGLGATLDTSATEEAAEKSEQAEKTDKTDDKTSEAPAPEVLDLDTKAPDDADASGDVTMADAKDEKIAPGSSENKVEPAGDESTKALEANAGEPAA